MDIGIGGADRRMQQALETIGKTGPEAEARGRDPGAPPEGDVERLNAALDPGKGRLPPVTPAAGGAEAQSMGDRIIQGISSAGREIQAGRGEALSVLGKKDVSQADLLKANFALMESSVRVSMASKTVEKITQGIKTLQQG